MFQVNSEFVNNKNLNFLKSFAGYLIDNFFCYLLMVNKQLKLIFT